ncbi:MAG TPA: glycosyltransferase family 2 protein [Gemmatimonadota bacterium]|nr:glycosyltransferase family 2 protein [Gemmatimonadota bacterium]
MDLSTVTPFILTLDEEPNIGRALDRLEWAPRVLVVDSGSTDRTIAIAKSYRNVDLKIRDFDSHAAQSNFALKEIATPWVLALDADYIIPGQLVVEMAALPDQGGFNGYFAPFRQQVLGKVLRRALYPPRQVLFRRDAADFQQDGHTQRVRVTGSTGRLHTPIVHDDRKDMSRWLRNQARYAELEASKLTGAAFRELDWMDRLRSTVVLGPPAITLHCLLAKGLILDGRAGLYYTAQRAVFETILSMKLLEAPRKGR